MHYQQGGPSTPTETVGGGFLYDVMMQDAFYQDLVHGFQKLLREKYCYFANRTGPNFRVENQVMYHVEPQGLSSQIHSEESLSP